MNEKIKQELDKLNKRVSALENKEKTRKIIKIISGVSFVIVFIIICLVYYFVIQKYLGTLNSL